MIVGMDFGTTNTGAAVSHGDEIHLIPLDPASGTPNICRTSLYLTRTRDYYLGSEALRLYFNQNIGRPSRYKKIKVGEILQIFAELPPFYREVFVYEDEYSPGRLFLSLKTALKNPNYFGTVFLDHWYSVSDLIAIFLLGMKLRIEAHLGASVEEVMLGRPVHFSEDPDEDKVAQSRLLEAAFKAGFTKVYLEYEPVAAALSYKRSVSEKQVILVFDFGGGTLDFTVMEIGVPKDRRVYATGGIPIAGDIFDQRLFRATIPKHLGEDDYFYSGSKRYPIPAHIFNLLSTPQEVVSLNTPQNLEMLQSIHQGAVHKEKTKALLQIVSSNYALLLFDLVERAKRQLSSEIEARISLKTPEFSLEEPVTRARFQHAIRREYEAIREEMMNTLDRSGLRPKDIDCVIRTGGSSQIPLFVRLLNDVFGWQKVREIDVFSSVTTGLSIRGWELASGQIDLPECTPETFKGSEGMAIEAMKRPEITEIDLTSVRQHFEVARKVHLEQVGLPETVLILANGDHIQVLPTIESDETSMAPWSSELVGEFLHKSDPGIRCLGLWVGLNDQVLIATSLFRLLLASARSVYQARQVSEKAVSDYLRLEPNEAITAAMPWKPSEIEKSYLCLVTRFGQARLFDARLLGERLSNAPFFQLEKRYSGYPVALALAHDGNRIMIGTSLGRVGCASVEDMAVAVWDILKARKGEEVTTAIPFVEGGSLLAMSEHGIVLPVTPSTIPADGPPALRGMFLRRNFRVATFLHPVRMHSAEEENLFFLTSKARIVRISPSALASLPGAQEPYQMINLSPGEKILASILR